MNNANYNATNKNRKYPLYIKIACALVSIIAAVYILFVLRATIVPVAFSALFAILLHPLCAKLESWRFPRVLAITLSIVLFIITILGLIYLASVQIAAFSDELPRFITKVEGLTENVFRLIEQNFHVSRSQQLDEAKKYLLNALTESRAIVLNTIVNAGGLLGTASLIPLYVFFFLLYRDFFKIFFYKALKALPKPTVDSLLKKIYEVIKSYLAGLVLVIGIVGILNSVGLLILGVDYAIFFGFFAAFLILIPYIGILIGSVLPALMSIVTEDSPLTAVGVIGVMAFVQFLEGNFITPNIVGSKVSVNPLAAIVMLLLGGELWGLAGLILALPLTAILKVVLDSHPSTEPYGFLLGEPNLEVKEEREERRKAALSNEGQKVHKPRYRKRKPAPDKNSSGPATSGPEAPAPR